VADSTSQASVNIESMASQMWISYGSAYKLNNVLGAMGKTTADLNEIALNPTLRQEYKDLQAYQEKELQLPSDYKDVSDKWATSVDESNDKLKMSLNYLKQIVGVKIEKVIGPTVSNASNAAAKGIGDLAKELDGQKQDTWMTPSEWANNLIPSAIGKKDTMKSAVKSAGSKVFGKKSTAAKATVTQAYTPHAKTAAPHTSLPKFSGQPQAYVPPKSTTLVPNSPNTYSKTSSMEYNDNRKIENKIYTSSNPQEVGNAVKNATSSANNSAAALLKAFQGLGR
jgi:hypothetical protein